MLGLDKTQVFGPGAVVTSVIDMLCFIGNSASLLLFLMGYIYQPVNSDGMFQHFWKVVPTDAT